MLLLTFIKTYPNNKNIPNAIEQFFLIAKDKLDYRSLDYFINNYNQNSNFLDALKLVYEHYKFDGEISSLKKFKSNYSEHLHHILSLEEDIKIVNKAKEIGLTGKQIFTTSNTDDELNKRLKREGAKTGDIQQIQRR